MAVFTKLEKNEIEDFLKDYSIGNLISFEGIVKGTENTNYKIITSKNIYFNNIGKKSAARRFTFFYGSSK